MERIQESDKGIRQVTVTNLVERRIQSMKRANAITDVRGIEVGHAQDEEALTGCTVILCRKGAVAGVDVRGGAPGTRETDLLNPVNLVEKVHAVVLAGGSAFGLDAASGVMRYPRRTENWIRHRRGKSTDRPLSDSL